MNVVGKISLGLTAIVALHMGGRAENVGAAPRLMPRTVTAPVAAAATDNSTADNSTAPDGPYATIVARNIFGLVPIPPPPDPPAAPVDPPPKITANGIMNVFGELEALFKVALPAKGSTPAKDQSYMLSQGQRQDDIEVIKIDEPNATITFDNHGTTQEISLTPAGKDSGSGPAAGGGGGPQPGGFNPGGLGRFHGPGARGGFTGGGSGGGGGAIPSQGQNNNPGLGQNGNNNPVTGGGSALANADIAAQAAQNTAGLTPVQQEMLIEANRLADEQQSQDNPNARPPPLLPPTRLTPGDATGPTGEPIIQSPETPAKP